MTTLEKNIDTLAKNARTSAIKLQGVSQKSINSALKTMAKLLIDKKVYLQEENARDLIAGRAKGLSSSLIDRLTLSDKALATMAAGCITIASLPSPIGKVYDERKRPNGLRVYRKKVPIGVVCIIYESRPNVTIDSAAICLKSQNAVILRGGSEAFYSNQALASLFALALKKANIPETAVQVVNTTDRTAVSLLLKHNDAIDLVIPRGGESLIRAVTEQSTIPVIKHYNGICHVFVSRKAALKKAINIIINAKVQRPGVCNAMETLLIDAGLPVKSQTALLQALIDNNVTLFGDPASRKLIPTIKRATKADWAAEYLDLRCAVRIVKNIDEAIDHINTYGSRHTDAIVSESAAEAKHFIELVDSSSVMINASTRLADGGEYGMGCEIGISTDKLHARGPMGIDDLTTYKWVVEGNGQIRK